ERRFICGDNTPSVNRFGAVYVETIPELDRWTAQKSPVTAFVNESAHTWLSDVFANGPATYGSFDSYESPFVDWNVAWQLGIFRRDAEVVELAIDSKFDNWLHAFNPAPDAARCSFLKKGFSPDRHIMGMEPFMGMWSGNINPAGEYHFGFYLNFPNNTANGPDRRYLRTWPVLRYRQGRRWATEEEIKQMAENGTQVIIHHHDSPSGRGVWPDGSFFWPDGVVHPYPPEEETTFREVIDLVHKYGMKIIPYFNPFELHPLCEEFARNEALWARTSKGQKLVNHTAGGIFGIACCMCSPYQDFLKKYVREVIESYGFDGAYYDGLSPRYCDHPEHDGGKVHSSIDEMIDLVRYTRELVGDDGLVILHNTSNAYIGLENYCNSGLSMEDVCGYANFTKEVPSNGSFGEVFRYGNHIARIACYYTALCKGTPDYDMELQKFVTRAHLEGIHFYTVPYYSAFKHQAVPESYLAVFKELDKLGYENLRFYSTLQPQPVTVSNGNVRSALYVTPEKALLLLGNADSGKTETTRFELQLPHLSVTAQDGTEWNGGEISIPAWEYRLFMFELK
ncbi:MAG: hypothetical protein IJW17_09160, partial [Lentisphaeria bacterium]|nr:hypothetical protein [Lentisphaeria bacterium]